MFYLAHISDIHLTPMPKIAKRQLFSKRITGYLNLIFNRKKAFNRAFLDRVTYELTRKTPDYLAISGDLVNLATKQEFANAKLWLQNVSKKNNIALCFGNHDAYVTGTFKYACNIFGNWLKTDLPIEQVGYFPNVKIAKNVAIINVSSAIAAPPFCAFGYFSAKQAKQLEQLLQKCAQKNLFRVVNIHHPPFKKATRWYKKLWGLNNFIKAIKNQGAELIIHGHTHKSTINYMFNIPIIGVGSASIASSEQSIYNIFAIEKIEDNWHCTLNSYSINEQGYFMKKASIKL